MFHHDERSYEAAVQAAAEFGRRKFSTLLEEGRVRSAAVLQKVMEERPVDALLPSKRVVVDLSGPQPIIRSGETEVGTLHRNAMRQLSGKAGLPLQYVEKLLDRDEPWARELAERNFAELLSHSGDQRFLVRKVRNQVRAVLSDSYKRLDAPSILESFVTSASALGAVPIDAIGSDLRVAFRFALNQIFEPMKNEVLVYGAELRTSDYGVGSLSITFFAMRVTCTNLAVGSDALRRVHLGARLTDESIQFSSKTTELDAATVCSAMKDVVSHLLGEEHIRKVNAGLLAAGSEKLGMGNATALLREYLPKAQAEAAAETFEKSEDVIELPPEPTRWRLSNVLSLLASKESDAEKRLDLQDAAGKILAKNLPVAFA